ncbi:MAG: putative selenium-dependent hydroxylase accessory protein YqeC [Aliivibrio sp.]|uniref:selenium cofactor biosynthesis protein YqeC n=1 Tax=Aliivibrio sp. TaxID=1872443 RepID=UPI001A618AE6|nr:putative selenium-dependent hydroxylase accessory protein YqeC [Aliivibrio sp.]
MTTNTAALSLQLSHLNPAVKPSSRPLMISLVGGGGKTSSAFWLAQQFKQAGHCVLVSTTTKMYLPEQHQADHFIFEQNDNNHIDSIIDQQPSSTLLSRLQQQKHEVSITFCFQQLLESTADSNARKVTGITPSLIDNLKNKSPFTVFIIEADGAKQMPIKAPSGHEPCIPLSTDIVVGVTGAESINAHADPMNIHRWNCFSLITQCKEGDEIDHQVLGKLLEHSDGMFKQAPENAIKIWLINKVDLAPCYSQLQQTAQHVFKQVKQLDEVWFVAMHDQTPIKELMRR